MTMIAGIDGCRAGWFGVWKDTMAGSVDSEIFDSVQQIMRRLSEARIIAVDIPIGLTESGPRECDIQARIRLGPRRSSVFPAPLRPLLTAKSRQEADAMWRAIEQKGVSAQAFAIYHKILEFDQLLSDDPSLQKIVKEVHPELCFWAWNRNRPMAHSKKSEEGKMERRRLITSLIQDDVLAEIRSKYLKKEVADDDIHDAVAALWTAERILSRSAGRIPENPPQDRRGLWMEMWY